ncbi:hypothetical protein Tco_0877600 [Tanacetum coccineum]|uniref:Uncharacterized protein n=1 Tax=Tanacetum coccineum TaxID=301880 RepID=A0ABQ5C1A0_9ASTR
MHNDALEDICDTKSEDMDSVTQKPYNSCLRNAEDHASTMLRKEARQTRGRGETGTAESIQQVLPRRSPRIRASVPRPVWELESCKEMPCAARATRSLTTALDSATQHTAEQSKSVMLAHILTVLVRQLSRASQISHDTNTYGDTSHRSEDNLYDNLHSIARYKNTQHFTRSEEVSRSYRRSHFRLVLESSIIALINREVIDTDVIRADDVDWSESRSEVWMSASSTSVRLGDTPGAQKYEMSADTYSVPHTDDMASSIWIHETGLELLSRITDEVEVDVYVECGSEVLSVDRGASVLRTRSGLTGYGVIIRSVCVVSRVLTHSCGEGQTHDVVGMWALIDKSGSTLALLQSISLVLAAVGSYRRSPDDIYMTGDTDSTAGTRSAGTLYDNEISDIKRFAKDLTESQWCGVDVHINRRDTKLTEDLTSREVCVETNRAADLVAQVQMHMRAVNTTLQLIIRTGGLVMSLTVVKYTTDILTSLYSNVSESISTDRGYRTRQYDDIDAHTYRTRSTSSIDIWISDRRRRSYSYDSNEFDLTHRVDYRNGRNGVALWIHRHQRMSDESIPSGLWVVAQEAISERYMRHFYRRERAHTHALIIGGKACSLRQCTGENTLLSVSIDIVIEGGMRREVVVLEWESDECGCGYKVFISYVVVISDRGGKVRLGDKRGRWSQGEDVWGSRGVYGGFLK